MSGVSPTPYNRTHVRVEGVMGSKRTNSVREGDTNRLLRSMARKATPTQIPPEIVDQTGPRREGGPVPVHALVPVTYSYSDVLEVEGEVVAWTNRAVLVRAVLQPDHAPVLVWVWANAVKRR